MNATIQRISAGLALCLVLASGHTTQPASAELSKATSSTVVSSSENPVPVHQLGPQRFHVEQKTSSEKLELNAQAVNEEISSLSLCSKDSSLGGKCERLIKSFNFDLSSDAMGTLNTTYTNGDVDNYHVKVIAANDSRVVFEATAANGETIYYDSAATAGEVSANAVIAIIPVALVSLVTALKWVATGIAIVVAGVLLMDVVKSVPKLMDKYRSKTRKKQCVYFEAHRRGGKVYIGKKTTRKRAIQRGRGGGDTWSNLSKCARGLAQSLNTNGYPDLDEPHNNGDHKSGYFAHWHPYKHTPWTHLFFGYPTVR